MTKSSSLVFVIVAAAVRRNSQWDKKRYRYFIEPKQPLFQNQIFVISNRCTTILLLTCSLIIHFDYIPTWFTIYRSPLKWPPGHWKNVREKIALTVGLLATKDNNNKVWSMWLSSKNTEEVCCIFCSLVIKGSEVSSFKLQLKKCILSIPSKLAIFSFLEISYNPF